MAQRAIKGENVVLNADMNGTYIPFACATSVTFTCDTDMIERATVATGGYREFKAGFTGWEFSLDTITYIVPPQGSTQYTVFDTLLASIRKAGLDMEMVFEDAEGNIKTITGHAFPYNTEINASVDDFSQDSVQFRGSGPFALNTALITPTTPNIVQDPIFYTSASGGETSLTYALLIGRTLLLVTRDGIDMQIITTGTAGAKQVKFDDTSGDIFFETGNPLGIGEIVHILYK